MAPTSIRIWTEVEDRKLSVATYFPHQHGGTLEYEKEWIQLPGAYAISPALSLHGGKQPLVSDRGHLPTALSDSAPDRRGECSFKSSLRGGVNSRQKSTTSSVLMIAFA